MHQSGNGGNETLTDRVVQFLDLDQLRAITIENVLGGGVIHKGPVRIVSP